MLLTASIVGLLPSPLLSRHNTPFILPLLSRVRVCWLLTERIVIIIMPLGGRRKKKGEVNKNKWEVISKRGRKEVDDGAIISRRSLLPLLLSPLASTSSFLFFVCWFCRLLFFIFRAVRVTKGEGSLSVLGFPFPPRRHNSLFEKSEASDSGEGGGRKGMTVRIRNCLARCFAPRVTGPVSPIHAARQAEGDEGSPLLRLPIHFPFLTFADDGDVFPAIPPSSSSQICGDDFPRKKRQTFYSRRSLTPHGRQYNFWLKSSRHLWRRNGFVPIGRCFLLLFYPPPIFTCSSSPAKLWKKRRRESTIHSFPPPIASQLRAIMNN